MPILIIESRGKRQAGILEGRVLIGRWPNITVSIDDRAVSRIHAWIGLQDGRYYVADAGSRTGTFVNGQPLRDRYFLADSDEIRVGPAIIHYHLDDIPPSGVETIDLSVRSAESLSSARGVFKDCVCGAPLWLPQHFSGVGQCRYCGCRVKSSAAESAPPPQMPTPPPLPAIAGGPVAPLDAQHDDGFSEIVDDALQSDARLKPPAPSAAPGSPGFRSKSTPTIKSSTFPPSTVKSGPTIRIPIPAAPALPPAPATPRVAPLSASQPTEPDRECGVCHSSITLFDETSVCPSCGLVFHSDCWQENQGCSSYGCAQVGALSPQRRHA